jgi:hypothetical protein
LALRRRCNAFSGVLRSSLVRGVVLDSIPGARKKLILTCEDTGVKEGRQEQEAIAEASVCQGLLAFQT